MYLFQGTALLLILFANSILGLFVYKNNPASATNRIYAILAFIISPWLLVLYTVLFPEFSESALLFSRLSIFFAAPMNFMFFLLAHTLPSTKLLISRKYLYLGLFFTLCVMGIAVSPFALVGIDPQTRAVQPGPGMLAFAIHSLVTIVSGVGVLALKRGRAERLVEREQLSFVLLGMILMHLLLIGFVMVPSSIFNNYSFVPVAPIALFLFLGMTGYAIIRHRFLDIRLILYRTVSFLVATLMFSGVYSIAVFAIIHRYLIVLQDPFAILSSVGFTAIAILCFDPIKQALQKKASKLFFRGEYDKDMLLSGLAKIMSETIDLDILTEELLAILRQEMRLTKMSLILDADPAPVCGEGSDLSLSKTQLGVLKVLFEPTEFSAQDLFILTDDLGDGPVRDLFRETETLLAVIVRTEGKRSGVVLLGSKLSGEVYNQRDIDFFTVLAPEVGIAIQNARSYTEIKNFSKKLEQRVVERTKELKESQERELEKAHSVSKLKDEFVFVAAHELRTPITAIRGFLELVADSEGSYPKDVQEDLDNIRSASEHLNQLVNDLLEIARSEAEAMKLQVEPIDVVEAIQSVTTEVSSLAIKKGVIVNTGNYVSGIKALGDKQKLREVLVNLVGNAIKYNRDNGIININMIHVEDFVLVEIADTGFGIPQEQQEKIFQKFFRASSQNTQGILGTGLGLFITRMLVEKMGGSIVFSSVEGQGTTFSLLLPKAQ